MWLKIRIKYISSFSLSMFDVIKRNGFFFVDDFFWCLFVFISWFGAIIVKAGAGVQVKNRKIRKLKNTKSIYIYIYIKFIF